MTLQGGTLQKRGMGGVSPETKKCFLWYESNVEIGIGATGRGVGEHSHGLVQTVQKRTRAPRHEGLFEETATTRGAVPGREILH